MAERVRITEVGPRDGLQNEPGIIPTEQKVRLVELCCATGVDEVEVTSFVSPKWVPQLGDAESVFRNVMASLFRGHDTWPTDLPVLSALVPNSQGLSSLRELEQELFRTSVPESVFAWVLGQYDFIENPRHRCINKYSVFTAASETFNKKNTNSTIAESIERFRLMLASSKQERCLAVRGYISCVVACPFEGRIAPQRVADVAIQLAEIGVDEIDLGDTIGVADVEDIVHLIEVLQDRMEPRWFEGFHMTLHLHDTFGHAADCVKAALDLGIRSFDGSVAGLGGCPYASTPGKRAPGNISTETLVRTVHEAGFETGVDLDKLAAAADYARKIVAESRKIA